MVVVVLNSCNFMSYLDSLIASSLNDLVALEYLGFGS